MKDICVKNNSSGERELFTYHECDKKQRLKFVHLCRPICVPREKPFGQRTSLTQTRMLLGIEVSL